MTISLPGSKKRGLAGLFGQKKVKTAAPASQKRLDPAQVARLFQKGGDVPDEMQSARLNDVEREERDNLSNLRGVLYTGKR